MFTALRVDALQIQRVDTDANDYLLYLGRLCTFPLSIETRFLRCRPIQHMECELTWLIQINWRMRVTLNDGRSMTGQMLAFDKVYIIDSTINNSSQLICFIAHEPRSRRY